MSQSDYNIANADGATVRADINSQLDAIGSQNSGSTAPPVTFPYMRWFDTANQQLKERNGANTAWRTVAEVVDGELVPYAGGESADARYARAGGDLAWQSKAIGEPFALRDDLPGVSAPPTDSASFRFIRLTAGEDGVGGYNEGVLVSETITGAAPLITATAVISMTGTPLDGQAVNLINTERRFVRAGGAGTLEESQFESHSHSITSLRSANSSLTVGTGGADRYVGNTIISSTNAAGGNETRPRNIGVTYYMRIF